MEFLLEYLAKGFLIMLAISMPCVLTAAGIGLVVGILQAVTQVQEQTIAAAPKILGVFLVIIIKIQKFMNLLLLQLIFIITVLDILGFFIKEKKLNHNAHFCQVLIQRKKN